MLNIFFEDCQLGRLRSNCLLTEEKKEPVTNTGIEAIRYSPDSIITLILHLDLGDLRFGIHSDIRKTYINQIYKQNYLYEKNYSEHTKLDSQLVEGVHLRIWCSHLPQSICGLYYICNYISSLNCSISVVELPIYSPFYHKLVSWGRVNAEDFEKFICTERFLSMSERNYYAGMWNTLSSSDKQLRLWSCML